jgi:hypothetical protein
VLIVCSLFAFLVQSKKAPGAYCAAGAFLLGDGVYID